MRRSRGFTMMELIVAMGIIATLAGIFLPNLRTAMAKSHLSACQQNLKNLSNGVIQYSNDNDRFYPSTLTICVPQWMKAIPTCPSAHADTYTAGYEAILGDNAAFTVVCSGTNHDMLGYGDDEPWWATHSGLGPPR